MFFRIVVDKSHFLETKLVTSPQSGDKKVEPVLKAIKIYLLFGTRGTESSEEDTFVLR